MLLGFGGQTAQFFDLVLDGLGHGLEFVVGERLKGAFGDFLTERGVETDEVFQLQFLRRPHFPDEPLTLALSPSDGFLLGALSGALVVGFRGCEFGLVFVVPVEECWFGEVEVIGDANPPSHCELRRGKLKVEP